MAYQPPLSASDRFLAMQQQFQEEEAGLPKEQESEELRDPAVKNFVGGFPGIDEGTHLQHNTVDPVENLNFSAFAQEVDAEEEDNDDDEGEGEGEGDEALSLQSPPTRQPKKRKHNLDEDDLPGHSQKKQATGQQIEDQLVDAEMQAALQVLRDEEEADKAAMPPPPRPTKRKRVTEEDESQDQSSAPPPLKKPSKDIKRKPTPYCGVKSPAIHEPPEQPKKGGFATAGEIQYTCPRCKGAFARPDSVQRHFPKCIELNGNPNAVGWSDYQKVQASKLRENVEQSKPASNSNLPTPGSTPLLKASASGPISLASYVQQASQAPHPPTPGSGSSAQASALGPTSLNTYTERAGQAAHLPILGSSPPVAVSTPEPSPLTTSSQQASEDQSPRQRKEKQQTPVCGVYSPAINDPPLQPPKYGKNQGKNRYHCPICDYAYAVKDSIFNHFAKCVETNGNPHSLAWTDFKLDPKARAQDASAKRKRNDDDDDEAQHSDNDGQHSSEKTERPQQKRAKRAPKKATIPANNVSESIPKPTGQDWRTMFPQINEHPRFKREVDPRSRPGPGMMSEIDMCWQYKQPGATISLNTELALLRGEIMSARNDEQERYYAEKKEREERAAAEQLEHEEEDAFFAQFEEEE